MVAMLCDGSLAQSSHFGLALCGNACLHCVLCLDRGVAYTRCFMAVFEVIVDHSAQRASEEALRGPEAPCFL